MIEKAVRDWLVGHLEVAANYQTPAGPPDLYVRLQKTGSIDDHGIITSTFAVQSVGKNLLRVMELNETVKDVMSRMTELGGVYRCHCEGDYDFTDADTKEHRYQAVFQIVHMKGI